MLIFIVANYHIKHDQNISEHKELGEKLNRKYMLNNGKQLQIRTFVFYTINSLIFHRAVLMKIKLGEDKILCRWQIIPVPFLLDCDNQREPRDAG